MESMFNEIREKDFPSFRFVTKVKVANKFLQVG